MTMPFLQQAVDSLRRSLQSSGGVTVRYAVIGGSEIELTAIPGNTDTQAEFGDGVIRTERSHDFIIAIEDLGHVPQPGDRIVWDGRTYEVMNPTGLDKHYDEVGPYQQMYRIHTKQVYGS